jgi:hypothetical protein
MSLNFPSSPSIGQIYTDSVSGFSYEWNGTVWISFSGASSSQIKILDDISGSFTGVGQTFALTSNTISVTPPTSQSLIINLGGVIQDATDDYSVSGSNIVFSTPPTNGLSFSGISLGPAVPIGKIFDGAVTDGSLTVAGILSTSNLFVTGISTLGNTVVGGATTQLFVTGNARVTGILTIGTSSLTLDGVNDRITVGSGLTITTSGITIGPTTINSSGSLSGTAGTITTLDTTNLTGTAGTITTFNSTVGSITNLTSTNVNASGIVTATTFVGALTGTASNVTTNANLTGDVTSVGNATAIAAGVIVNADINASAAIVDTKLATIATAGKVSNSATTATNANTASAIVARDASGNFTAGTITANLTGTASNVTTNANLTGDVTSVGNATSIAAGVIVNADINASAGIVDTKLATIATAGKVSNSATTATNANTASAIVARDASGNFSAGTITAALTGAASSNVLKAGDTMTGALVVPRASAATPSLTFTGDLNTGIFSPGANLLAVATNGTGRLLINNSGAVIRGHDESVPVVRTDNGTSVFSCGFQVVGGVLGSGANQSISAFSTSSSAFGAQLYLTKSNTATIGDQALVANNDLIGVIQFQGSDGTQYRRVADIRCDVDGVAASGDVPGRLVFRTNPAGSTTPLERLRIDSSGNMGIGDLSPSTRGRLSVVATTGVGRQFVVTTAGQSQMRFDDNAAPANLELQNYAMTAANHGALISWSLGNSLANAGTAGRITVASEGIWGATSASRDSYMAFSTTLDGSVGERARIDSRGRLLVGTSSAGGSELIQVQGTSGGSNLPGGIALRRSSLGNGDDIGYVNFTNASGNIHAGIKAFCNGTPGASDYPGALAFYTTADGASSPTERMWITSGGHVLLGTTSASPSSAPEPSRLVSLGNSSQAAAHFYTDLTSKVLIYFSRTAFGITGSITTSGTSTAYNTSSDYRLKENIVPIGSSISRLLQLKPSRFNFIADPDTVVDGFIAHEAQEVVPECVTGTKDEVDDDGNPVYQGIDQSKLVPLLTAALQEAVAEIKALKDRVTALETA